MRLIKIKNMLLVNEEENLFRDYSKRLTIFIFLLHWFSIIAIFAVLLAKGVDFSKSISIFKAVYFEIMIRALGAGFFIFPFIYLMPLITKIKWRGDYLYIKPQCIGFCVGLGIGIIETLVKIYLP